MRVIAILMALSSPAFAQEWNPVDARAKGMGDVGTAIAEGAAAGYWNPSLLAKSSTDKDGAFSFGINSFGMNVSGFSDLVIEGETIATLDRIADLYEGLSFQAAQGSLNTAGGVDTTSFQSAIQVLDEIRRLNEDGQGLYATGGGSLEMRFGPFTLFHRENVNAGGSPFLDIANLSSFSSLGQFDFYSQITGGALSPAGTGLANALVAAGFPAAQDADGDGTPDVQELAFNAQQGLGDAAISDQGFIDAFILAALATNNGAAGGNPANTLYNNQSGIEFKGIWMRETGVGIGVPLSLLPIPFLSTVNVGITLKEVIGETYYGKVTLAQISDGENLVDELRKQYKQSRKRSNQFTIDGGISVEPIPWFTAGIAMKNLIPMHFRSEGPDDFTVKPQLRGGVGFQPLGLLKIGMDLDLTENDLGDYVSGLKSRMGGLGVELTLPVISLRTGTFANLSNAAQSGGVWTGGIGFSLFVLHIDLDAQVAFSKTKIETGSAINGTDSVAIPERVSFSFSVGLDLKF